VSYSYADVEDRLKDSFRMLVSEVPDQAPEPWSIFVSPRHSQSHHLRALVGAAASIVLIGFASLLWASPSAGERYHGPEAIRAAPAGVVQPRHPHSVSEPIRR
jgi:hypothetical protein